MAKNLPFARYIKNISFQSLYGLYPTNKDGYCGEGLKILKRTIARLEKNQVVKSLLDYVGKKNKFRRLCYLLIF